MSVNKLYICAVDDEDVIQRVLAIAKSSGGEFGCYEDTEKDLNEFLLDAFIDGYGIAFKDDGDLRSPSFYLFPSKKEVKFFRMEEEGEAYYDLSQDVFDPDNDKHVYGVCDLSCNCPEDAVINRDLVSAYQWLGIVNYGIELAKQGYDKAEFEPMEPR